MDAYCEGSNKFSLELRYCDRTLNQLIGKKHCYVRRLATGMGRINIVFEKEAFYGIAGVSVLRGRITMEKSSPRLNARCNPTESWKVMRSLAKRWFYLAMESAGYSMRNVDVRMCYLSGYEGVLFRPNIPSLCPATEEARTTYIEFTRAHRGRVSTECRIPPPKAGQWDKDLEGFLAPTPVTQWTAKELEGFLAPTPIPTPVASKANGEDDYDDVPYVDRPGVCCIETTDGPLIWKVGPEVDDDDNVVEGDDYNPRELDDQITILKDIDETAKWLEALYNY